MAQNAVKLLTAGSVKGSIREFFDKLKAVNTKHGKFDLVLCVGDFFGPGKDDEVQQLLDGELEPPVECYIMQGEVPLPEAAVRRFSETGGELCKGLFLLSKSGMIATAHGLRIACLGGIYDESIYSSSDAPLGFLSPHFSAQTVERLLSNVMSKNSSQSYKSLAVIQSSAAVSQSVDILITHAWPESVSQFSSIPLPRSDMTPYCAPPLDEVVRRIKPRYHFASGGGEPPQFWEREPFVWDEHDRVSRFISLGSFGAEVSSGKKPKWFYAFAIQPNAMNMFSNTKPVNTTRNPFLNLQSNFKRPFESAGENYIFGNVQPAKRQRNDVVRVGVKCRRCESTDHIAFNCPNRPTPHEGYVCRTCNQPGHFVRDCPTRDAIGDTGGRKPREGYICRACGSDQHFIEDCLVPNEKSRYTERRGRDKGPPKEISPNECWFCLSNPDLAKHLIVAIGTECYLTLPKGQIPPTRSPSQTSVPGGGHVLIVPIAHYPTYNTIPPDLARPILEETDRYKSALHAFYGKHGAVLVVFEVGRLSAKGGHAHVQAVPIPRRLKEKVEDAFINEGSKLGIDFEADPETALESCTNGRGGYFRVDLPDGRKLVHLIRDHAPFSVQFGRQVLVNLMDVPERVDWRTCVLPDEDDKADAEAFKTAFTPFNPV